MKAKRSFFVGLGALLILIVAVGLVFASDASPTEEPAGSPFFDATLQQAVDELDGKARPPGVYQQPQPGTQHYTTDVSVWPECQFGFTRDLVQWPWCHYTSDPNVTGCDTPWPTKDYTWDSGIWPECVQTGGVGITQDPAKFWCDPLWTKDPGVVQCNPRYTTDPGQWPWCNPRFTWDPAQWPGICQPGVPYTYADIWPECNMAEFTTDPYRWAQCHYTSDPLNVAQCLTTYPTQDYTSNPGLWPECPAPGEPGAPPYTMDPMRWPWCDPAYTIDIDVWPECRQTGPYTYSPVQWPWCDPQYTLDAIWPSGCHYTSDPAAGSFCEGPWPTKDYTWDFNIWPECDALTQDPLVWPWCLPDSPYTLDTDEWPWCNPAWTWDPGTWDECKPGYTNDPDTWSACGIAKRYTQEPTVWPECEYYTADARIWPECHLTSDPAVLACSDGRLWPTKDYTTDPSLWPECDAPPEYTSDPDAWPECHYTSDPKTWEECLTVEVGDLGDAPDSTNHTASASMTAYPAGGPPGVLANFPSVFDPATPLPPGPMHWNPRADSWLGPWVTLENDADLMPDEDGLTNIDPPGNVPDLDAADDGLLPPVRLPYCQQTTISVTVTVTPGGATGSRYLNVWLDFNRNGDWADSFTCPDGSVAPEWAVQDYLFSVGPGPHIVTVGFLSYNPRPQQPIWMRITLSDVAAPRNPTNSLADGRGPPGGYYIGETEDYYLPGEEALGDLGDAPDSTNHPGVPMTAYPAGGPPGVPASFPSVFDPATPLPPGPKHWNPRAQAWLGKWVTLEDDADLMPDEDGLTNIDPRADRPDRDAADDGLIYPVSLPHCQSTWISVTVTAAPGVVGMVYEYLNVWLDFNRDGDWADTLQCPDGTVVNEWAVQDLNIGLSPGMTATIGMQILSFNPPPVQPIWMRITLSDVAAPRNPFNSLADGRGPAAGYDFGETEDYYLPGETLGDLGDAPDSTNHAAAVSMTAYPPGGPPGVLASFPSVFDLATGLPPGPKHWSPRANAWLGPWVTLEEDADLPPDEDVVTNIDPPGDMPDRDAADDGVLFPVPMPHCVPSVFSYTVTIPPGAARIDRYVNVWFDWTGDGDWADFGLDCPGVVAWEWAVQNQIIPAATPPGVHIFQTPVYLPWHPQGSDDRDIWMRISIAEQKAPSPEDGRGPRTGYQYGETEDYYLAPQDEEYDIYIKDSDLDDGSVPSPVPYWVSPDIWTRNDGDCSQTSLQNPIPGQPTTVCVRVRNRMATAVQNITVNNYYANAALALAWPGSWSYLGAFNIPALAPNGTAVMSVPWNVPLLATHFCLLSRADAPKDPLPTGPDTTPPVDEVPNNNNIGQKNLWVVQFAEIEGCHYYSTTVDTDTVSFDAVNTFNKTVDVDVEFDSADFPLGAGTITVEPASLWGRWASLTNLSVVGPTTLEVTGFPARMEDISMTASEIVRVTMNVSAEIDERFTIQVTEYISGTEMGGIAYVRDLPFCLYLPIITKDWTP